MKKKITFYSPRCLDQETAKGPLGLRVKLSNKELDNDYFNDFIGVLLLLHNKQYEYSIKK